MEPPCRIAEYAFELECGQIDQKDTEGRRYTIHWYRIPAKARYPLPDPIVYIQPSMATSPHDSAIQLSYKLRRLLAKRDFIWINITTEENKSDCKPKPLSSIEDHLNPYYDRLDIHQCKTEINNNDIPIIYASNYYAKSLLKAVYGLGLEKINIVTWGLGYEKAQHLHVLNEKAIKSLVIQNPANNQLKPSHIESIMQLKAFEEQHKVKLNESIKSLLEQLPKTYKTAHPVTQAQQLFTLTPVYLYQLIAQITRFDVGLYHLSSAIKQAKDDNNIQKLLGLASYQWSSNQSQLDINWAIRLSESCQMPQNESKLTHQFSFFNNIISTKRSQKSALCKGIKKSQPFASKPIKDALVFYNRRTPFIQPSLINPISINKPEIRGKLMTHGCGTDVVYKFISHGTLSQDDTDCLTNIPALSNQWGSTR